ncbi:MAG: maltose alpha-D-glucosyltransferase [Cyclobacteriaceae bacterium]
MSQQEINQDDNLLWYKDAIIYELHIKAFMDANNDGIGDFEGLLSKLDYLEDLGVTAIWLLPFYPSPLRDDGYDIQDYYNINTNYGHVNDFKKFVTAAHDRNIKVITELVINHTSDQHPWFQRARKAPKGSPERDYYVWSDDPNKYAGVRIIFQDYEASNWTFDKEAGQYYWHRFFHHQPDLNYENLQVQEEVFRIIDYWSAMGVDGFRLDAVPYLYQKEGTNCENLPETHAFLKKLRAHVDESFPGTMLLAEANMWPEDSAAYFGDGDECHMNYHFPIMPRMFMAMRMEDRYPITDIFDQTPEIPENSQWAIFLRNHDELTLEMVTDEERDYMYKVYAQNPKARVNLGLRRRLAPLMDNNRNKIELINTLLYSLPGTPVIYYGDEIGMGDNFYLGDRDGVRTPMQWSPDRNAGFSKANPQELYLPTILDPEHHYESVNVETQQSNPYSLLWWTRRIINMRKKYKAFSRGDLNFIPSENSKVLAFTRSYQDETILVVVNLSRYTQAVGLDLSDFHGYTPIEVFSKNEFPTISESKDYFFTLSPHAYHWFELRSDNILMDNLDENPVKISSLADIKLKKVWSQLEHEYIIPYITESNWYKGLGNKILHATIKEWIPLEGMESDTAIIIVELKYQSGLPDLYQIALAFGEKGENNVTLNYPKAIIANALSNDVIGYLYDAFYDSNVQEYLFRAIGDNTNISLKASAVGFFDEKKAVEDYLKETEEVKPRMLMSRKSNTSILFNNDFYLKIYRRLDIAINPDLEVVRYMTTKNTFKNIPDLKATIQLEYNKENSIVLGILQSAVDYQTDMWTFLLDAAKRYSERIEMARDIDLQGVLEANESYKSIDQSVEPNASELVGLVTIDSLQRLGERTAEFHLALHDSKGVKHFEPELFSLHYQRSLYSSFQSLVREAFQKLGKIRTVLPSYVSDHLTNVLPLKDDVLGMMRKIYEETMDTEKIRIHGDFHLKQVLHSGQDFMFIDFEGEAEKSYSERRLKKSALRDVASMINSIHRVVYESVFENEVVQPSKFEQAQKWADVWFNHVSKSFLKGYFHTIGESNLVPATEQERLKLLNIFIMERAVIELITELRNPSDHLVIPLLLIERTIENQE